ncbi:chorismate mutase [Kitasatospora nipponensis]
MSIFTPPVRTVTVADAVFTAVPQYVLGLLARPAVPVSSPSSPAYADARLRAAEDRVHARGSDRAGIAALPPVAGWRAAHRAVGGDPVRHPCAAEALLRRHAGGGRLPRINSAVDLANALSLESGLPVASMAVAGLDGELTVRPATGTEVFHPLGSPAGTVEAPAPGEVVYADAAGTAHSRHWNWRQGDTVRTVPGTHDLLFTVECAHAGGRAEVSAALAELRTELGPPAGEPLLLDAERRSAPVSFDPLDCLRGRIDALDDRILALLGERVAVVREVARYKSDESAVRAPARVEQVVRRVTALADRHGVPAGLAERLYRLLIEELTELELSHLR